MSAHQFLAGVIKQLAKICRPSMIAFDKAGNPKLLVDHTKSTRKSEQVLPGSLGGVRDYSASHVYL